MKKTLIAIDASPIAERVVSAAFDLSKQINADIALLSVVDTTFLITEGAVTPREVAESIKNDFKKRHELFLNGILKGQKVWTFIEEGKPSEIILRVAEEWQADIIAIGTHGRTGLSHLLMGSVAEKVIRHSTKPLFVIPYNLKQ